MITQKNTKLILSSIVMILVLLSCDQEVDINEIEEVELETTHTYNHYRDSITDLNRVLVLHSFEQIENVAAEFLVAYRIKHQEGLLDLDQMNIDSVKSRLTDSGKKHMDTLLLFRDNIIQKMVYSEDSLSMALNAFTQNDFYTKTLFSKDDSRINTEIVTKEKYKAAVDSVVDLVQQELAFIREGYEIAHTEEKWKELNPEKLETDKGSFLDSLSSQGILFSILLLVSVIANILLILGLKKVNEKWKKKLENTHKAPSTDLDWENPEPEYLPNSVIHRKIDVFVNSQKNSLQQKYGFDPEKVLGAQWESLLKRMKSHTFFQNITSEEILDSGFKKIGMELISSFETQLKPWMSKVKAEHIIDKEVSLHHFSGLFNPDIVSEQEVASKLGQYKTNLKSDLAELIRGEELSLQISDFKSSFAAIIQKMMEQNLVFYFPFTDAKGELPEEKKTKTKERDSALRLQLSPDDTTQATFRLVYENEEMMRAAILSYDSLLLPICDLSSENFARNGTKITQLGADGVMVLEHGKWKIDKRLTIKVV